MVAFYNAGDQAIYNQGYSFIPQERFRLGDPNLGGSTTTAPVTGGINTVPINMGGGGGGIPFSGTTSDLTTDFMNTITDRQNRLNNPSSKFLGFNTMRDQQLTGADLGEYIGSNTPIPQEMTMMGKVQDFLTPQSADQIIAEGYEEPRFQPGIISAILGKVDRYGTLPRGDQAFIARNMGYTGPTVFGENASGLGKDPFGLNVRSGFGNYAERVGVEAEKLGASLGTDGAIGGKKDFQGATFNPATGMFEADEDSNLSQAQIDALNQRTKMVRAKYNFYTQKENERIANEKLMEQQAAAAAAAAAAASRAESRRQYDPNKHGGTNYGLGSDGQQSYSGDAVGASGLGFGVNATSGGPVSNRTGRGRTDYMNGGLANLVDIYD